ncbi:hypothetical protein BC830DRAFT_1165071 [Chytriomyces sp. MP71]|nr:hypothetical protein BC830DRAFT_1165071 [Chytriomyces sp. MP71]
MNDHTTTASAPHTPVLLSRASNDSLTSGTAHSENVSLSDLTPQTEVERVLMARLKALEAQMQQIQGPRPRKQSTVDSVQTLGSVQTKRSRHSFEFPSLRQSSKVENAITITEEPQDHDDDFILESTDPLPEACNAPTHQHTLAHLLYASAAKYPNNTAIVSSESGVAYTYSQLVTKVDLLSQRLKTVMARRITHDISSATLVVGVLMDKTVEATIVTLAVTVSGATWLPFDSAAPSERVRDCLGDADAVCLIYDEEHASVAQEAAANLCLSFDELATGVVDYTCFQWKAFQPGPERAAYYIYTSGSTGKPKGISLPTSAVFSWALSESSALKITSKDILWNGFSLAFDMWVEETWCALSRGACLVVANKNQWHDLQGLSAHWHNFGVTIITAVPTLMSMVCMDGGISLIPESVRIVNVGGEACTPALAKSLQRPGLQLYNTYGPSETTVTATYKIVNGDEEITIGKPLPNYHCCILQSDKSEQAVALTLTPGVVGELAIGGPCLAHGYVKRQDLTDVKFVPHPTRPGEKVYRTGDLVTLSANCDIVYIGRIDTQVKYRGFRIELGEIEAKLCAFEGVATAAVILSQDSKTNIPARLEAYIVFAQGGKIDTATIRNGLASSLMPYMLPDAYIQIKDSEMPRLLSGKIDRNKLMALSLERRKDDVVVSVTAEYLDSLLAHAPASSLEIILAVLGKLFLDATVKATDDFFADLGGHSLIAANFVSMLRKGIPSLTTNPFAAMSIADVYRLKTADAMAQAFPILSDGGKGDTKKRDDFVRVPTWRFLLCGLIQIPLLCITFFLSGFKTLGPFIFFIYLRNINFSLVYSFLFIYAYGIVVGPTFALLGITLKWALLGKVKAGNHPLYGSYYLRAWFVGAVLSMSGVGFADTPLMPVYLRLLGAKIGRHVHIGTMTAVLAADLLEIEDGVTIGNHVALGVERIDRGQILLRKITVKRNALVGTSSTVEGPAMLGEGCELKNMTFVPQDTKIPEYEVWYGSPARRLVKCDDVERKFVPSPIRKFLVTNAYCWFMFIILPAYAVIPSFPLLILYDLFVLGLHDGTFYFPIAGLASLFVSLTLVILSKWIFMPRIQPGTYSTMSFLFVRKWFADSLVGGTLSSIHTMWATLYAVPFLRLLGMKIGARCEVSTTTFPTMDLVEIGEECFLADNTLIGDDHIRGYEATFDRTVMRRRAFVGNSGQVPQGHVMEENTLVGVFSAPPQNEPQLEKGQWCFGIPSFIMPGRKDAKTVGFDESLLFKPHSFLYASRLFIEGIRVIFPSIATAASTIYSLQVLEMLAAWYEQDASPQGLANFIMSPWILLVILVLYLIFYVFASICVLILLKWLLNGRYKPSNWPMWSFKVWLSEFVTSLGEAFSGYLTPFVGTPYLAIFYRVMGSKVGKRVYFANVDIPEFDCLEIGDDVAFNAGSFPQTHLFEDRIMKVARVKIGSRVTMSMNSIALADEIEDDVTLGSNSVAMRGETLGGGRDYHGSPAFLKQ